MPAKAITILDGAFYLLVAVIFVSLGGTMLLMAFPAVTRALIGAGDNDHINYVRNFLELVYFVTNAMVAVAAVAAIRFARRQVLHAQEQNRISAEQTEASVRIAQAGVYMRLVEKIASPDMEVGIYFQKKITADHAAQQTTTALGSFAHAEIDRFSDADRARFINFLIFLEDVGLMARRQYLSMDDVYFLLEGPLKVFGDVFMEYLEYRRARSYQQRMCEHAIWLLKTIRTHVPQAQLPPEPA